MADATIVAIANQKGGVGKSTTAINLGAGMAIQGDRVLLVDLDPQGNTSSGLGIDRTAIEYSTYDILINEVAIDDVGEHWPSRQRRHRLRPRPKAAGPPAGQNDSRRPDVETAVHWSADSDRPCTACRTASSTPSPPFLT